ncbi:MAG: 2OG-Fe(II) oxygenase [Caulobacteraceae bacterium]
MAAILSKAQAKAAAAELDRRSFYVLEKLLSPAACVEIASLWKNPGLFRKKVVMAAHGFGAGEYGYFAEPLPAPVQALREGLFPPLAALANQWAERLGRKERFPDRLEAWLDLCHRGGQLRPTPLLLRYGPGDYNRLHRDLYGPLVFPLQATILLSEPGLDFSGGEFLLAEQEPRAQTRVMVVPLARGDAVVFSSFERPVPSARRGWRRVAMRHGVSDIRVGERTTLGIIFHDAA